MTEQNSTAPAEQTQIGIAPERYTLSPSEFDEVRYWTAIHAQIDAANKTQELGPLAESLDLYADAAIALALSRVFPVAVTLPLSQYDRLFWAYVTEVGVAMLRRMS